MSYFSASNFNHYNEINQSKIYVIPSKITPKIINTQQKFTNINSNFDSFIKLISHSNLLFTYLYHYFSKLVWIYFYGHI